MFGCHPCRLWATVAVVTAAAACWMRVAGLTLAWRGAALPAIICAALEALGAFYTFRRPDPRLATSLSGVAQLVAFSAAAACLSYAAAATAGPFWDEALLAADRGLGLDWRAYLAFVNGHPWLGWVYAVAYRSLKPQLLLVVLALGFSGRATELRRFLFAFMITALMTILLSALMPAMAMYSALQLKPEDFPRLDLAAAYVHVPAMNGLRDGSLRVLSLADLEGIITFPSLHAGSGVLLGIAFWSVGWLRWPALALNVLLIAATPIDGGHYFIDVLAGGAIALLAYAATAPRVAARSNSVEARSPRTLAPEILNRELIQVSPPRAAGGCAFPPDSRRLSAGSP